MLAICEGIRAQRLINQVMSAGTLDGAVGAQTLGKLELVARAAIPKIVSRLGAAQHDEAGLLIELLRRLIDKNTLALCLPALAERDERVVSGVVSAIAGARGIDATKLLPLLDDANVSKPAILEILSAHKHALHAESLLRYAYKLDYQDQTVLFRIIEEAADEQLVPALINRLDAQDPGMRARVAGVLSRFPTPAAREALHRLLEDNHKTVRLAALEALARTGAGVDVRQVCRMLKEPDIKIQTKAIEVLVSLNHPDTVKHLLEPLRDESEHARRAAVEVINEIGTAGAIKDLLVAIKDSDWWVRTRAADALGRIGGPRVVESVVTLIKDEDEFVRRAAIEIVNATKDPAMFDHLLGSLDDSDWWVQERAVDALAALGNKRAVPSLIRMLDKPAQEEALTLVLVRALGKLGSNAAVEPVIEQLKVGSDNVRREALQALASLVDEPCANVILIAITQHTAAGGVELRQLAGEISARIRASYVTAITPTRLRAAGESDSAAGALVMPETVSRGAGLARPETVDMANLQPGDVLAERYRYIRPIGKGAFGAVYLMEDLMIREEIILKFLNAQVASDESSIKRFVYELRFARRITHRNVIRIFDMITFGNASAISMEYFPSHTLGAEIFGRKPMDTNRGLKIMQDVCAGMEAAHHVNVVHRDLKPSNILINDLSLVKIVDFGVAAAVRDTETRLTKTGLVIGTPTYMAPEQVLGKPIDARTDIYSLGIILYEMMTGRPPYRRRQHGGHVSARAGQGADAQAAQSPVAADLERGDIEMHGNQPGVALSEHGRAQVQPRGA
ncbi:MAG: HEAT repeat domain-containing protein [Gammaproteobacteria bacterium]|nr:HEAT repeat domain-containing protein [Gammaproteobacteria bacterium]